VYSKNAEPSIKEMLLDPMVRLRMERAGIVPETVETLLRDAKQRLQVRRNEHLLVRRPQRES
jgi:hypothetical protein